MQITRMGEKIKLNNVMDVSTDVHKDVLNFYFEVEGYEYSDECKNRTKIMETKLKSYHDIAKEHGRTGLRIICEPTGGYQNKLLRTARRMGFLTSYVNTESVSKFRIVETNDNGKTDTKDPRVINTLGQLDKVIKHRILDEDYAVMRRLGKTYDNNEVEITRTKCKLSAILVELFCDYSFGKDFLYSSSGKALSEHFGFNPYRIIDAGYDEFYKVMKESVPKMRNKSLKRLWSDASSSVLNELPLGYIEVVEMELKQLLEDFARQLERKESFKLMMLEILEGLRDKDPNIPPPTSKVISDINLARLLGEIGPLDDFNHWRQLMRYGGINICERQSGKYQGQNKISKKGRPLLRKILNLIVLPLIKKSGLYGEYYHRKKDVDKMPGTKAMMVVSRNFLRKFYGWYKSGQAFDLERFFACETQYKKAA